MKTLTNFFSRAILIGGLSFLLAGFARTQTQDTVYLITFKRVTTIPQPCPGNMVGCLVYHCKYDTSGIMTKIFYEEKDADKWIKENKNTWMWEAIEIKKEKLTKARANSR